MLCEINPLIVTPDGEVKALDSKFTVDDNALFRHPDISEMRDTAAADPLESFAREKGVTYVKLDGDVGICGNGAGLSMSTVDVVAHVGGKPANFCDLGGGGNAQGVVDALEVITRDPQVKSIFFNIFGGITRGDEVARGILEALDRLDMSKYPIVVRLDGTNAEEGRKILADAGKPNIYPEATMLDGAKRAVRRSSTERPERTGSARVTDVWSDRAEQYRQSPIHAAGEDLDLVVEWCEPGPGVTVLDVATGGGHVARRLREAGATVVTVDPAPGMQADTTAAAEDLPFADGSFDAVACRIAAHHFADVIAAVKEMARVAKHRVVICDNTFVSESSEEADRLRDPSHVRNYSQPEWHSFFELAGLEVADERHLERALEIEPWLARVDCVGEDAARVRELLGDRVVDGVMPLPTLVLKGVKS